MCLSERVTVRVPATSANLGPGFDCLGMAVDIWNELTIEPGPFRVTVEGDGAGHLPEDRSNLVVRGVEAAFRAAGKPAPELVYTCRNAIPHARGLGSSSAAIVSGLLAGMTLSGMEYDTTRALDLAANIEGHPDNVAPAIFGGCRIGIQIDGHWRADRINLPTGLRAVLFVPDIEGNTAAARAILPSEVSRADAVFNMGRAAMLVNALSSGNLSALRHATEDRLHQPERSAIFKGMKLLIKAALDAGAHGAFLSGAGPTVMALTTGREVTVNYEMSEAARLHGLPGRGWITRPTERGAYILEEA